MTAAIEARRLSGEHIGMVVENCLGSRVVADLVTRPEPDAVIVWPRDDSMPMVLAPSDLVTVTGRGQS